MVPNQLTKTTFLHASLSTVWEAVSESENFGSWFGVRFDGPFILGESVKGVITPTTVDPEVAASQKPYEGMPFTIWIEAIEPLARFAFRWHPDAIEEGRDYSKEPTTLVEFVLSERPGGVLLTLIESGFDQLPEDRRAAAFSSNQGGWAVQMVLIEKYLAGRL